jgi:hypothetical protein
MRFGLDALGAAAAPLARPSFGEVALQTEWLSNRSLASTTTPATAEGDLGQNSASGPFGDF